MKLHVSANGAGGGGGGLGTEGGGDMGGMGGCMGGMGGGSGEGSGSGSDMHHSAQRPVSGYAFSLAPMGRLTEVPSWNLSGCAICQFIHTRSRQMFCAIELPALVFIGASSCWWALVMCD